MPVLDAIPGAVTALPPPSPCVHTGRGPTARGPLGVGSSPLFPHHGVLRPVGPPKWIRGRVPPLPAPRLNYLATASSCSLRRRRPWGGGPKHRAYSTRHGPGPTGGGPPGDSSTKASTMATRRASREAEGKVGLDSAGEPELSRDWCSENPRLRLVNDQRGSRARPDATLHVRVASSHWPRGYRKRVLIGGGAEEGSGPQSPLERRDGAPRSRHFVERRGLGAFILQHGYTRLRAGEPSAKGGDKLQPRPLRSLTRGQPRARSPRGAQRFKCFLRSPRCSGRGAAPRRGAEGRARSWER